MILKFAADLSRAARRGYSLVEMAIVLGIVSVVFGGVWIVSNTVTENTRRDRAFNELILVVHNIRTLYQGRASISGDYDALTSDLISRNVFPSEMIRNRSDSLLKADMPWGRYGADKTTLLSNGAFAVRDGNALGGQYFIVELRGLATGPCVMLAHKAASVLAPKGLDYIYVNGNTILDQPNGVQLKSVDATKNFCQQASSVGSNVDLVYRLRISE